MWAPKLLPCRSQQSDAHQLDPGSRGHTDLYLKSAWIAPKGPQGSYPKALFQDEPAWDSFPFRQNFPQTTLYPENYEKTFRLSIHFKPSLSLWTGSNVPPSVTVGSQTGSCTCHGVGGWGRTRRDWKKGEPLTCNACLRRPQDRVDLRTHSEVYTEALTGWVWSCTSSWWSQEPIPLSSLHPWKCFPLWPEHTFQGWGAGWPGSSSWVIWWSHPLLHLPQ